MVMETHRRHHQQTAVREPHQGPGRRQGRERFAKAHLIGQQRPAAGQQPTHPSPLVGQQLAAIGQGGPQIRRIHQLPVGRQRRQGPIDGLPPLPQAGVYGETLTKAVHQAQQRL